MKTSWEILNTVQIDDDTIITTVEIIIDDNPSYIIDIPHFRAEDEDEIIMNVVNRTLSERKTINQPVISQPLISQPTMNPDMGTLGI